MDQSIKIRRPILILSNSSRYLLHYRKQLFEKLTSSKRLPISLSPIDSATPELSHYSLHIPWRIYRRLDTNLISVLISLFRLVFLVRSLKPALIHSHTLRPNLLASINVKIQWTSSRFAAIARSLGAVAHDSRIAEKFFDNHFTKLEIIGLKKASQLWGFYAKYSKRVWISLSSIP